MTNKNEIIMYTTDDGLAKIQLQLFDDTVWLTQLEMAELFQSSRQNIAHHIKAIFDDGELDEKVVSKYYLQTTQHGALIDKTQTREVLYYNLDMILAIGYRVRSLRGVQFRVWANTILKEYLVKGFAMNDERLKDPAATDYYEELMQRIRSIRTSEKRLYAKVLEIFATSIDYNKDAKETKEFFQLIQNKLHFAITGKTAPEIIYERVDANQRNLGLTSMSGDYPKKSEVTIAKNYLNKEEIIDLEQMTTAYLDIAERSARGRRPMHMKDWILQVDNYLELTQEPKLIGKGKVTRKLANEKAHGEYEKYVIENPKISEIERDYLALLDEEVKKLEKK